VELTFPLVAFAFNLSCMTRRISPVRQMEGVLPLFPAGRNGGPTTLQLSSLSSPALLNVRSTAAEMAAAAAGGGAAGAGAAGAAKGGLPGGREGTCHQASTISGQPVVPCKRRLLWRMAPTATNIHSHMPSPNCTAVCGRITSCRGVHQGGGGGIGFGDLYIWSK
jgi:hypothetical protein